MLRQIDNHWIRHLTSLDMLREGIGLRAIGQQNPLVAYQKEAFETFQDMLASIQTEIVRSLFTVPSGGHNHAPNDVRPNPETTTHFSSWWWEQRRIRNCTHNHTEQPVRSVATIHVGVAVEKNIRTVICEKI